MVVFFSGFINLIPAGALYPATVIIDGLYLAMFAGYLGAVLSQKGVRLNIWVISFVLLVAAYLCLFLNGGEPIYDKYLTLRNQVLYAFVAIFLSSQLKSRNDAVRLLTLAMRLSVLLAIFGILQFVFRNILPEWLLVSKDTALFGYYGTDITRSTGLIGNTIVFSNVLLLFFSLHVAKLVQRFKIVDLMSAALLFTGILLTFSRIAIVGAVIISLALTAVLIFRKNLLRAVMVGSTTVLIAALAAALISASERLRSQIFDSFIFRDLFLAENASVQSSTDLHNVYIEIALETLRDTLWFGLGISSQNQDSINAESDVVITDGAFWSLLAEGGLFLFICYSLFLLCCSITAVRSIRNLNNEQYLVLAFLAFSAYQFFASAIYNSAYFGKAPFILYWFIFGIVIAIGSLSRPLSEGSPDDPDTALFPHSPGMPTRPRTTRSSSRR